MSGIPCSPPTEHGPSPPLICPNMCLSRTGIQRQAAHGRSVSGWFIATVTFRRDWSSALHWYARHVSRSPFAVYPSTGGGAVARRPVGMQALCRFSRACAVSHRLLCGSCMATFSNAALLQDGGARAPSTKLRRYLFHKPMRQPTALLCPTRATDLSKKRRLKLDAAECAPCSLYRGGYLLMMGYSSCNPTVCIVSRRMV